MAEALGLLVRAKWMASATVKLEVISTTRVQRPERDVQMPAALLEGDRELKAIHGVATKQAGKEQHFGGEEQPHAEAHGLVLPADVRRSDVR